MTTAITVNIILSAVVFAGIVGFIAGSIHVSRSLPEVRLGRLRTQRERDHAPASGRRPSYRSVGAQS